jgi:hypothetical protein
MACLQNVRIKQTVTYDSTPDLVNGLIQGQVDVEIFNTYGFPISGEVIVDRVRDLPVVNLEDDSISETQYITSTGDTFNYNFYYPSTEPINVVINIKVKIRIEDCFYEHTCSHVLLTPNPTEDFTYCDVFVQGYEVISGCTNPLFYEFNSNANFDDGSCSLLKPIYGCTNPLAVNYNPNADYNDGTCIFSSGCTNPVAVNYNPIAVIDDGSCECGDINVQLNFNQLSGESFAIESNCQYLFEFDWFVQIDCGKLIEYLQNDTRTILEVLGDLAVNAQAFVLTDEEGLILDYTGGTISYTGDTTYILVQNENLYAFDSEVVPYGIGTTGSEEDCDFVNDLISTELEIDCPSKEDLENRFKGFWTSSTFVLNSDLVNSFTKFNLNFENFNFGACVYLDNVKVSKLCSTPQNRCVIIPSQYGLEFDKVIDNKKAWLYSEELTSRTYNFINQETNYQDFDSRLILNTKELELTINPVKYIESDVLSYYEYYEKFFVNVDERYTNLSKDYITYEAINPIGRQFIRQYPFLNTIYEQYLDGLDCAPTKALDYPYGIEIINRTGDNWYSAVKQLLPATVIWNEAQYTYKNNIFHKPKHTYKKYTLGGESDTEIDSPSGVTVACTVVSDKCLSESFDSIDGFLSFDFGNIQCTSIYTGGTIGYSGSGGEGNFSGKIIQFSTNENGENTIENYFGFNDYNCITGEPIPTCEGVVISANLSFECIQFESVNTGFADVTLTVSGGQAPYTITGYYSGTILTEGESVTFEAEDGDIIIISVEDANGCTSTNNFIEVDCPIEENNCIPVTCGDNQFQLEVKLTNDFSGGISGFDSYVFEVNLTSPTSYLGTLMGSYKISDLNFTNNILVATEKYHSGANYTPDVELSNYIEFGFNQLTPNGDANTAGETDSPWYQNFFKNATFVTDNPNFIIGNDITVDIALFDEDFCVHKTSITLTIPTDDNSTTVTSTTF